MSAMQAEVFEAFRAIDVPEDKALRAAADAAAVKGEVSSVKADTSGLKADMGVLKADVAVLKTDVGALKADMTIVKADITCLKVGQAKRDGDLALLKWMTGFVLAFTVAIAFRVFTH